MNETILSVLTLASTIAPPKEGSFGKNTSAGKEPTIELPSSRPKSSRAPDAALETEQQRKERLLEEGVRQAPPKPPERDYLSVLKSRPEGVKSRPNEPPLMRFNLGFGSWFPVRETVGRKSVPLGAHHVGAQLWAWGSHSESKISAETSAARYSSLSLLLMSTSAEVSIAGYDEDFQEIRYTLLASDLDSGLVYKHVFQWPLSSGESMPYQLDFAVSLGYLPLRQRYLRQFGTARAKEQDYLRSGPQWNASSGLLQFNFSVAVLSLFEVGIFVGAVSGFPFEVKAWGGLEIAFRAARQAEEQSAAQAETLADPKTAEPRKLPKPHEGTK